MLRFDQIPPATANRATDTLAISHLEPLAKGSERIVYPHPDHADRVLKVLIPREAQEFGAGVRKYTLKLLPMTYARGVRKEIDEYRRLKALGLTDLPVAAFHDWVQTDLGPAMCMERVIGPEGALAPSLKKLRRAGRLGAQELALVNAFVADMYAKGIRAGDATAANIVIGLRPGGAHPEAVLIDGLGDIHAIPVRTWSRWTNALGLDDSFRRLARRVGWRWNGSIRQFEEGAAG